MLALWGFILVAIVHVLLSSTPPQAFPSPVLSSTTQDHLRLMFTLIVNHMGKIARQCQGNKILGK